MKVSTDSLQQRALALRAAVSGLGSAPLTQDQLSTGTQGLPQADQQTLQAAYDYLSKRGVVTPKKMDSLLNQAAGNAVRADRNGDGFVSDSEARGLGSVSSRLARAAAAGDGFDAPGNATHAAGAAATAAADQTGNTSPGAQKINDVLAKLDVQHNRRYQPSGKVGTSGRVTHCNEFAQDVLRKVGVPRQNMPTGNANNMNRWLNKQGPAHGWHKVSAAEAQQRANGGQPVLASWDNTRGAHGHAAVVKPGSTNGVHIAQAGGRNYNDAPVARGFGKHTPQYFAYDGPVSGAA